MGEKQQTINDLYAHSYLRSLSPIHIRALRLLEEYPQAHTARRIGVSRSFINAMVRKLEGYGYLSPRNGDRYNKIYDFPRTSSYSSRGTPPRPEQPNAESTTSA